MSGDWGDDVLETMPPLNTEIPLTPRQIELRDGIDFSPNQGEARLRRLEKLAKDHSACGDFVADLDRIIEHTKQAPVVNHLALQTVLQSMRKLRKRTTDKSEQLDAELRFLRSRS